MEELLELIANFRIEYTNAPLYGGYSRTLRKKIPAKSQVQQAFIDDIEMLRKTCAVLDDSKEIKEAIDSILHEFE